MSFSRLKDFAPALKHIADIIERGIREHPELSVGMQTEGIEVVLDQGWIVQAFVQDIFLLRL